MPDDRLEKELRDAMMRGVAPPQILVSRAADEIARLRAANAEFKLALEQFLDPEDRPPADTGEWREVTRVLAKYKK